MAPQLTQTITRHTMLKEIYIEVRTVRKYIKLKPEFSKDVIGAAKNPELKAAMAPHLKLWILKK